MDDVTANYPGLAPPTPGGRRSRSSSRLRGTVSRGHPELDGQQGGARSGGRAGAPNHAYIADSQQNPPPPADPPAGAGQTGGASKEDLNFGWFSVPKPEVTQAPTNNKGAGEGETSRAPTRTGSAAPRDVPSRTGSTVPREVPSRTGSTVPRDVPSRTGSTAPRDVPSRTGSTVPRDVPSRTGSAAPRDVPSRTGSTVQCDVTDAYQQPVGPLNQVQNSGEPSAEDDVTIDWPLSLSAQVYIAPRPASDVRQKRPGTGRCPSRSVAPPTPPPPITWGGYGGDHSRPTFSHSATANRCFFTGADVNNSNPLTLSLLTDDNSDDNSDVTSAASSHCSNAGFRSQLDHRGEGDSGVKVTGKTRKSKQPNKVLGDHDHAPCGCPGSSPGKPPSKMNLVKSLRQAFTAVSRWPQGIFDLRSQATAFKFRKFKNEGPLVVKSEVRD